MSNNTKANFINAKTGKRCLTEEATKDAGLQSQLDELRDMLEDVLAILQDTDGGINPESPAMLALHYYRIIKLVNFRLLACREMFN